MIIDNKGRKIIIGKNVSITEAPFAPTTEDPKELLFRISETVSEGGYNPVSQIVGYIVSEDPTHISNYKNARALISKIDRDELLEDMVKVYIEHLNSIYSDSDT
jgi:uncharacterized protein (UPF0297 family)